MRQVVSKVVGFQEWTSELEVVDKRLIYRFVGSFEYYNALESLGELTEGADENELAVYDAMIATRPEFSFYVGLSKKNWGNEIALDTAQIGLKKFEPNGNFVIQGADESGRRTGLGWLMALARIELAASLAAYTNIKEPFHYLQPSELETQQYEILLLDDAISHLMALQKDRSFKDLARSNRASSASIDYWRRGKLARELVKAARNTSLNNPELNEGWASALKPFEKEMVKLEQTIVLRLTAKGREVPKTSSLRGRGNGVSWVCGKMLAAERNGDIASVTWEPQK